MNIKQYTDTVNVPLLCFLIFTARVTTLGASFGEALTLLGFAALYGFNTFHTKKENVDFQNLSKQVSDLRDVMSSLKMEKIKKSERPTNGAETKRWF